MSDPYRPESDIPERPRVEPEIIPPGRGPRAEDENVFIYVDEQGRTHRKPLNTFTILIVMVVAGIVAATALVLVVGFALVWIPIAVVAVAGLLLASRIQGFWRRLTGGTR